MPYLSDWEMLSHAVERLSGAGVSLDTAKADIVSAIGDRKIRIRFEISQTDPNLPLFGLGEVMLGEGVVIPARLQVSDFDWHTFCPSEWWRCANTKAVKFKFKWLEVRREDVTEYLLSPAPSAPLGRQPASHEEIRSALILVYARAVETNESPPNIRNVVKPVKELLSTRGLTATKASIQLIGEEDNFRLLRRPPGVTIASEKSKRR